MIVLDTNVVSELMGATPSDRVLRWTRDRLPGNLYTTCVTEAEIFIGVRLLPKGRRRDAVEAVAATILERLFAGRVLPFESEAARSYARILAERRRRGTPMSTLDAQIAGIVRARGAKLASRNVADFDGCGIDLIDPWEAEPS